MAEYANPTALVSTQWVSEHLNDPNVRLIEVDVDTSAYGQGHIQGAVGVNWTTQLGDPVRVRAVGAHHLAHQVPGVGQAAFTDVQGDAVGTDLPRVFVDLGPGHRPHEASGYAVKPGRGLVGPRRPGFAALLASGFSFYRTMEARQRSAAYPLEELNDELRAYPEREALMAETLSYFDPLHFAPSVRAATLMPGDGPGDPWLAPLVGALGGPVEEYAVTHEGATDHRYQDAWLAARLGAAEGGR